ncbi:hypothetical protein MVEN_01133000 [Mycena venus]|uniref:Uncharacterized protein n=1 Tax=Mycena venus TaxID=2733690 RepID=A0A8H6YAC4_9AGAR|nr:hypothetical protein MVEN_01133000 [Mycena venus]
MRSRLTRIRTHFWDKVQQARDAIYKAAFAVTSDWVENILKQYSLVPTVTIIAVIEGLLPEPFNSMVMTMLFRLAEWHALTKLRMHTDDTLARCNKSTAIIGRELRNFRDYTKENFATKELDGEVAARARRKQNKAKNAPAGSSAPVPPPPLPPAKGKFLNLDTYKFHALGDYPSTVRFFGTTDSYSTVTGELAHRLVKRLYRRTNKNNALKQMAKLERREARLRKARTAADSPRRRHAHHVPFSQKEARAYVYIEVHHHIAPSRNNRLHLMTFLHDNEDDPAKKIGDFIPKLKNHLLGRLLQREYDGDEEFSEEQRKTVKIIGQHIYMVQMLRVNYTTYDTRIDQDSVNPRTHADVMVISRKLVPALTLSGMRVFLKFFTPMSSTLDQNPAPMAPSQWNSLSVRWFGIEPNYRSGFKVARLPKVGFVPEDDPNAFGFLDPGLPGLSGNQMIGQIFMLQFELIVKCSCVTLVGGIGHAFVASALPKDDLDAEEEEEILAPPDSSASGASTLAPQEEQPSAEVLLASQQPDTPIAEIPGEGSRGHPDGEGDDDGGGFDSEEDSDVEPQDLDWDDSDEGEGSDGAYDDDA